MSIDITLIAINYQKNLLLSNDFIPIKEITTRH